MPSETEEYLALAQRTANGLTRYWESWTDYLTTASRLYKYPFADQLMIYAQRPDATACADFDIWNNRMNRYVRWTFREKWQRAKASATKSGRPMTKQGFKSCRRSRSWMRSSQSY